jgi:hypothetical protein
VENCKHNHTNPQEGRTPYEDHSIQHLGFLQGDLMLRLKESPQTQIYEAMLPPELCKLNDELSKVSTRFAELLALATGFSNDWRQDSPLIGTVSAYFYRHCVGT